MMNPSIVLTGGGSAGHVIPNVVLIEVLQQAGWNIHYIGAADSIEKKVISPLNIPFHAVRSGKFRRYFSWKNFVDPFNIVIGILQSFFLLRKLKPNVIFSKGGFVALPVVVGAWLNKIPVVTHESDLTPGLANRLSFPFASKICVTFEAAKSYFKESDKVVVTGTPIRESLFHGQGAKGLALCGFNAEKPCLLVIGGSQGAISLNIAIRQALDLLTQQFQVIHICGSGKIDPHFAKNRDYVQFEYIKEELADLFAASSVVISRSGANALYELIALAKPHVLVPLLRHASRGDQIQNARYFQQQGISVVLDDVEIPAPESLMDAVNEVMKNREALIAKMKALQIQSATATIIEIIKEEACLKPNHSMTI